VDPSTIAAYDREPQSYAQEWHAQPTPTDLHDLVLRYFRRGPTADIGCGSGRDTAWLNRQGFEAVGYDVSEGLLSEARRRYPDISFRRAALPDLAGIEEEAFENILSETVIMHLPSPEIEKAVSRMKAILANDGSMYLSWRVTTVADQRTDDGRLYSAFDSSIVYDALAGTEVLHDSESVSASSGRTVHRLVVRKSS
jgi:SAM-dependent methyltransferase